MKKHAVQFLLTIFAIAAMTRPVGMAFGHGPSAADNPGETLKALLEGNDRFASGKSEHPNADSARLAKLANGQRPFACVLSCSDSRIPPEIVFDRGLGDLFVVRIAGNVPEPAGMESLRYAVDHLGPQLIIVLGHRNCGAVKAAVSGQTEDFPVIDQGILPAVIKSKDMPGDKYENATIENVRMGVRRLSTWAPFAAEVKKGHLLIVGGIYNLHTGKVSLIEPASVATELPHEDEDTKD